MEKCSLKNQSKVLKKLIEMCDKSDRNALFQPINFPKNFNFVSPDTLEKIIDILEEKELIEVRWGNYPEHFNIYRLDITPKGYDFHPQLEYINETKWCDRFWGFLSGSFFTAVISVIITYYNH